MALSAQRIEEIRAKYNISSQGATTPPAAGPVAPSGPVNVDDAISKLEAGTFAPAPATDLSAPPEAAPAPHKGVLDQVLDNPVSKVIQKLPGHKIGEAVGNSLGYLASVAHDAMTGDHNAQNYDLNHGAGSADHAVETAADGANAAITLAGAGASLPAKILPKIAVSAATGAAAAGTGAIAEGKPGDQAKQDAIFGAVLGGALPLAADVPGSIVKETGKTIHKLAIPLSSREAQIMQAYRADTPFWKRIGAVLAGDPNTPRTAEETAFAKGLVGTEGMVGVQARQAAQKLWKHVLTPQLDASTEQVHMPALFDEAEAAIKKANPELARQKDLVNALDSLRKDYAGVEHVSMKQLQDFKAGWAKFVPEKAYKGQPIGGAFNDVKNVVADIARKKIYAGLNGEDTRLAYIDYGNLKGIQELGQRAMTGGKLKGGTGGFISAIKDMVLTPVATLGGYTVYGVGKGIELIGKKGATVVGDIIPQATNE